MPEVGAPERLRLADAILEESVAAALDPFLVLAVIAVESGFDPDARSSRGALGLMQLRPATLEREALRSRLSGDGPGDPILNVRAGVRYFRRLTAAFGDTDLALIAYNAGPNRLLRYLREEGQPPEHLRVYPRRVRAELRRLQGAHGAVSIALLQGGDPGAAAAAPFLR